MSDLGRCQNVLYHTGVGRAGGFPCGRDAAVVVDGERLCRICAAAIKRGEAKRKASEHEYEDRRKANAARAAAHDRLHEAADALAEMVKIVEGIFANSHGLAGYHLNGDVAEWGEFTEFDELHSTLAAYEQAREEAK